MNRSSGRARMYSPFMWVSFFTSKKAGEWLTSSRRNQEISLGGVEDLLPAGGAPPQQGQVVDEGLGQVALVPVGLDRHRVPPLGQLLPLLVDQERQVGEDRQRGVGIGPAPGVPSVSHPTERAPPTPAPPWAWWAGGPPPGSRG